MCVGLMWSFFLIGHLYVSGTAECTYQNWNRYVGECIVSVIKIDNGVKEPTCGVSSLKNQSNIDIWWVCQGERIFCIPKLLVGSITF